MISRRLQQLLDKHHVPFYRIPHAPAFTAQEVAHAAHISGNDIAKTVMVKLDGKLAMVVMQAPEKLHYDALRRASGASKIELATEHDFERAFPDCELGAMPPFGNLYGLPVFATDRLSADENIAFNGGDHNELVKISWNDYDRLVKPVVMG